MDQEVEVSSDNITKCASSCTSISHYHKCCMFLLQHSVMFGQFASSQTVTSLLLFIKLFVVKNSLLFTNFDLIQSGFL